MGVCEKMSKTQKAQWDLVKFVTTLNAFGEVPFFGSFRWIQEWMGQRTAFPGRNLDAMKNRAVVIGKMPSALSEALRQATLSPKRELLFCDLVTDKDLLVTRTDAATKDVIQDQLCEVVMGADTVVFWVTSDSSSVWTDLVKCLSKNSEVVVQQVFDFTQTDADLAAWDALDDVVMGGVSQSTFFLKKQMSSNLSSLDPISEPTQYALFTGSVSTENSGGFSSVRTQNFEPAFDFSGWTGLRLRVKGDGQRYKFILRNSAGWDSPGYIYGFDTEAGVWLDVVVPFVELVPTFRAKSVPDAAAFDAGKIVSFQIMLSKFEYDRRLNPQFAPGPFELAVAKVAAYRERQGVPLIVVGAALDEEAVSVRQQAALEAIEVPYRWVEPADDTQTLVAAISAALAAR